MRRTAHRNVARAFSSPNGISYGGSVWVRSKYGLDDVSIVHFYTPVPIFGIGGLDHFRVAQRANTFVYSGNSTTVRYRDSVQRTAVDTKSDAFSLFRYKSNWRWRWHPFCGYGLCCFPCDLLGKLLSFLWPVDETLLDEELYELELEHHLVDSEQCWALLSRCFLSFYLTQIGTSISFS